MIAGHNTYKDIGSLAMDYITLTGDKNTERDNPGFDRFVQEFKESESIQAGGRLRAHRRPDEKLFWYVVTDENITYLHAAFPGAKFEQVTAFSICPEAGSQSEQTFRSIIAAAKRLFDEGQKITQSAIAQACDRIQTQSAVSKSFAQNEIIAKIGGTKGLTKIFHALCNALDRSRNIFSEAWKDGLDEDLIWVVENYLPMFLGENLGDMSAVAAECVSIGKVVGWRGIEAFLQILPFDMKTDMLAWLINLLHEDWRSQFTEIFDF